MSKKQTTIVNFVLDETGSMEVARDATIGGFNEYVDTLRQQSGKVLFTLTQFNTERIKTVYNAVPLKDASRLNRETYQPSAMTNLYDAIARTIHETEAAIQRMKTKPNVLCVIMTDGEENSSKEYGRVAVFDLIKAKEAEGWTFTYIGANQDAWQAGISIGVAKGNTLNYDQKQPGKAFRSIGRASARYFTAAAAGMPTANLFEGDDDA